MKKIINDPATVVADALRGMGQEMAARRGAKSPAG